jgi:hypothetical protein
LQKQANTTKCNCQEKLVSEQLPLILLLLLQLVVVVLLLLLLLSHVHRCDQTACWFSSQGLTLPS